MASPFEGRLEVLPGFGLTSTPYVSINTEKIVSASRRLFLVWTTMTCDSAPVPMTRVKPDRA